MNIVFSHLIRKLIELDQEIVRHNTVIDGLKIAYMQLEQELSYEVNNNRLMDSLQLKYRGSAPLLDQYKTSRIHFFKQMIETQDLIDQVKVLVKVFLNYDIIIEDLDVSKQLKFDVFKILGQFNLYPKRLSFLYKQNVLDESTYNTLYNEEWLSQNAKDTSAIFYELVLQYKKLSDTLLSFEIKNKNVRVLSEVVFKNNIIPSMTMISKIIEYLFAPKIDLSFSISYLCENFNYPTEGSMSSKIEKISTII